MEVTNLSEKIKEFVCGEISSRASNHLKNQNRDINNLRVVI